MYAQIWRLLSVVTFLHVASTVCSSGISAGQSKALERSRQLGCTLKDPLPTNLVCGLKGSLKDGSKGPSSFFADDQLVEHVNDCRDLCANRAKPDNQDRTGEKRYKTCKAFSYNATGLCELFSSFTAKNFSQSDTSSSTFYQFGCYDCPLTCPSTGTANLLDDPNFEISDKFLGPWYLQGHAEFVHGEDSDAESNAVFCHANRKCLLKQYRRLCLDQTYTFSMNMKVDSTEASSSLLPTKVLLEVGDFEQELHIDWLKEFNDPSGYITISGTFLSIETVKGYYFRAHNEATSISVRFAPQHGDVSEVEDMSEDSITRGTKIPGIYLDKFSILPAPTEFKTQGSSLVKNGGFESGKRAPWRYQNELIADYGQKGKHHITSPGLSGSKFAFELDRGSDTAFSLVQHVRFTKGKKYFIRFEYESSQETGQDPDFRPDAQIYYTNTTETQYWGFYLDIVPNEPSPFQRIFVALEDTALVSVRLYHRYLPYCNRPNHCRVVVDNIDLRELL